MAFNNAVNATHSGMQAITTGGVWNGRTITAGAGITVTNGDGISGNPTIAATGAPLSSQWTLIATFNLAGVNSVTQTTGLTAYNELYFGYNYVSGLAGGLIVIAVSTDGGASYANSLYNLTAAPGTSGVANYFGGPADNQSAIGWYHILNTNAAEYLSLTGFASTAGGAGLYSFIGQSVNRIGPINAVKFYDNNINNFTSGTLNLYGR